MLQSQRNKVYVDPVLSNWFYTSDLRFGRHIDDVLNDDFFNGYSYQVNETAHSYIFQIDVPGFDSSMLNLQVEVGELFVSGEKVYIDNFGYQSTRKLNKSFCVPEDIDPDRVEAECINGVLKVTLYKRMSNPRRNITIEDANCENGEYRAKNKSSYFDRLKSWFKS